jgi:hypothetical protein
MSNEFINAYMPFSWMIVGSMSCLQFADCILFYFSDDEAKKSAEVIAASKALFLEKEYEIVTV